MKKKVLGPNLLLIISLILSLVMVPVFANDRVVTSAHEAAIKGLPALLDASPLMKIYRSKDDVKADKDSAFQVFIIDPQGLAYGDAGEGNIHETPLYCFLVKQGKSVVGVTTVEKIEGQWEILTFGSAEMAIEVNQIFETYPVRDGYTTRYLRSYQSFSDYFEISKDDDVIGIVPLSSGRMAMELENKIFNPKELFQKQEIFFRIGHHVLENLNNFSIFN